MVIGDSLEMMRDMADGVFGCVLADPPYGEFPLINESIEEAHRVCTGTVMYFMHLEDIAHLAMPPERVYIWVKPSSPKPYRLRWNRTVEAICLYRVDRKAGEDLFWTNHNGVFTDIPVRKEPHPYYKPLTLLERLLRMHGQPDVLDPFAGSGSVSKAAGLIGWDCTSIEIDPKWEV